MKIAGNGCSTWSGIRNTPGFTANTFNGHIIYAEDNLDNQSLVKVLIKKTGAQITLANNGEEALNILEDSENRYDLILMDLQMPVMDGYEASRKIRELELKIPIVACSASALTEIETINQDLFDDYLGKPVEKAKLHQVLSKYLH